MKRDNLISWQWSDYFLKHQNKLNLFIHIVAIPLFWIGSFILVTGSYWGLVHMFLSFALQGVGHKLEKEMPAPFLGPIDFVTRFLTEQFVTFPRFVFTGGWLKALRDSK